jgi:hypothetical protein
MFAKLKDKMWITPPLSLEVGFIVNKASIFSILSIQRRSRKT